jgi:hypothetical protein
LRLDASLKFGFWSLMVKRALLSISPKANFSANLSTLRNRVLICATFIVFLASASPSAASPTFANAVTNGTITITGLSEASGIVASRNNPDVLWTHNDSGHPAQIYAIDTQARLLGTYNVPGNSDNEDIAIGPGPVTNISYLYIGDIGDNGATRANIKVYQIPEPAAYSNQFVNPGTYTMKGARTITLTYPDGARDAEAMFVDPITGALFILTKANPSRIYTAPKSQLDTNDSFTLTFVQTLAFNIPNAADIRFDGSEIIVRQEEFARLWLRTNGQPIADAFLGTAYTIPVTGTANGEPNGEAIGFDSRGSGYFTVSDNATTQPLRYFARTSNDGPAPGPRPLIAQGSAWKYLDDGSNQGTNWRLPDFNDTSWKNGPAQFGYGDADEATTVSYGPAANNKFVTTYFRKSFDVANASDMTNVVLKMVVDDGAAIFINGTAALYEHLASGASYSTLASPMTASLQSTWHAYELDPRLLHEGSNTIAVEVHQCSVTSSNISFDLQLLASGRNAAYESFNYPVGTPLMLVTNQLGQWWTTAGSGSSTVTVAEASLIVPGLAPSSAGCTRFGASNGPSARFNLPSNVTSGTLFFSMAMRVDDLGALTASGGWFGGFNNSRGAQANTPTVFGTRLLARTTSGGFNLGLAKNTTAASDWVWSPNLFNVEETVFLVGSYTFNTGSASDDVAMLWLNPNPQDFAANSAPPPTLTATAGADIGANQIASFVLLQQGLNSTNQPGAMAVDELRIGSTWASVTPRAIPEPVLEASITANQVLLLWSTNTVGFVHESSTAFNHPATWTIVAGPYSIADGKYTVVQPLSSSVGFYRLKK